MGATTVAIDTYRGTGIPGDHGVLVPVGASSAIKAGTMLIVTAGYWLDGADSASSVFGGIATETVTGGATDGAVTTRVRRKGVYSFAMTGGSAATDVGKAAFLKTNAEVGLSGDVSNAVAVGIIVGWDTVDGLFTTGANCLVDITGF